MKEYISLLFGVCALSGMIGAIAPQGQTKKYLEIICSLCVICALAVPLLNGISEAPSLDNFFGTEDSDEQIKYEEIYNNYILEGRLKDAEAALASDIEKACGAPAGSLGVRLDCTETQTGIEPLVVTVIISPRAIAVPPEEIKEFVANFTNTECTIVYGAKENSDGAEQKR